MWIAEKDKKSIRLIGNVISIAEKQVKKVIGKIKNTYNKYKEKGEKIMATNGKINIGGLAELDITYLRFQNNLPGDPNVRAANGFVTAEVRGPISYFEKAAHRRDTALKVFEWSLITPEKEGCYKDVTITYTHDNIPTVFTMPSAFVVDYSQEYENEDGMFTLVIRQRKDSLEDVTMA